MRRRYYSAIRKAHRQESRAQEVNSQQDESERAAKEAAQEEWQSAEATYQQAELGRKAAEEEEAYAHSEERKWGYAVTASQSSVAGMEARVKGKLKALLDERELIMDILGKLRSAKLSASKAMGMVQKSLAQCSICKAWRGLVPSARGRGGGIPNV